jgi:hypothetical protein
MHLHLRFFDLKLERCDDILIIVMLLLHLIGFDLEFELQGFLLDLLGVHALDGCFFVGTFLSELVVHFIFSLELSY